MEQELHRAGTSGMRIPGAAAPQALGQIRKRIRFRTPPGLAGVARRRRVLRRQQQQEAPVPQPQQRVPDVVAQRQLAGRHQQLAARTPTLVAAAVPVCSCAQDPGPRSSTVGLQGSWSIVSHTRMGQRL